MDGFAVRAADVAPGAELRVLGDLAAGGAEASRSSPVPPRGSRPAPRSRPAPTPCCASRTPRRDGDTVTATAAVARGLHIRRRAEDVHAGDVLARPGDVLTVPRLSALASAGVGFVDVPRTPRVDLVVTGSELLQPGAPPEPGKIYESNSIAVGTLVQQAGARLVHHPPVPDDRQRTAGHDRARPGGRHPDRLRRRLGRPARPRQARLRGLRRRGGLLARADQARQAAVVRPPRRHARLRAARQPAVGDRLHGALRPPRPAPAARRARPRPVPGSRPARRDRGPVGQPHDVPDLQARPGRATACRWPIRPSARART